MYRTQVAGSNTNDFCGSDPVGQQLGIPLSRCRSVQHFEVKVIGQIRIEFFDN
jgi:hypothetical protein